MDTALLNEVSEKSLSGSITFPEVVGKLIGAGIEFYHVNLIQNLKTFYSISGESFSKKFEFKGPQIPASFSAEKMIAALRAIQAGKIKYREFLVRIMEAGTSDYKAYLTGKKVIYFGRLGDFHIENFPAAQHSQEKRGLHD